MYMASCEYVYGDLWFKVFPRLHHNPEREKAFSKDKLMHECICDKGDSRKAVEIICSQLSRLQHISQEAVQWSIS